MCHTTVYYGQIALVIATVCKTASKVCNKYFNAHLSIVCSCAISTAMHILNRVQLSKQLEELSGTVKEQQYDDQKANISCHDIHDEEVRQVMIIITSSSSLRTRYPRQQACKK